jgi:hypothetical protein
MLAKLKEMYSYNEESGRFTRLTNSGGYEVGSIAGRLSNGYISIGIDGKEYGAHRLAWLYVNGEFPLFEIDHKNRDRSNNAIDNLRAVTSSENNHNREIFKSNTSGCKGVSFTSNRWRASISIDGKRINLGRFTKFSEAVDARMNAEILYGVTK